MVTLSGRDTWLAAFISSSLGILWLVFLVMKTSDEKFSTIMKKPAGKIVGFVLFIFLIEAAILMIYDFMNFFRTLLLPKTPPVVFSVVLVLLCAYALSKGFETVARLSTIFISFNFVLITLGLLGSVNKIKIANILPVLENGIKPPLRGALFQFSNFGQMLALYSLPVNISAKDSKVKASLAVVIIYLLIAVLSTELVSLFGVEEVRRIIYKLFEIFRFVNIKNFVRIETAFIPLWFTTFFIKVSILYYAILKTLQLTLELKTYRYLIIPTGIILVALTSLSFSSYIQYSYFYVRIYTYMSVAVMVVVPLALLLINKNMKIPSN